LAFHHTFYIHDNLGKSKPALFVELLHISFIKAALCDDTMTAQHRKMLV